MRNCTATQSPRNYPVQNLCINTNAFHIMRFLFHNSNDYRLCHILPGGPYDLLLLDVRNKLRAF